MSIKLCNPFVALARWSSSGGATWHMAALAAGWLSLFFSPPSPIRAASSPRHVFLGAAVLILALLALGPALGALQPVLAAAGRLDGGTLAGLSLAALNLWRYQVGKNVLRLVAATAVPTAHHRTAS